jgi:hypothetical protein
MENPTTNSGLRPQILPIWPGDAPGSAEWNYAEKEWYNPAPDHLRFIRNVTQPNRLRLCARCASNWVMNML